MITNACSGLSCDEQRLLYRFGVGVGPVCRETKPQRQAARPSRQVMGVIGGVPDAAVDHVKVGALLLVRLARDGGRWLNERTAIKGREQPFMRINDEAVSQLHAVKLIPDTGCCETRSAVGAIYVHPNVIVFSGLANT